MNDKIAKLQSKRAVENRAFWRVAETPDGKIMIEYLKRMFGGSVLKKAPDGRIDPNAVMAAVGEQLVIKVILEKIENGKLAR